jgi:hypothetical protein
MVGHVDIDVLNQSVIKWNKEIQMAKEKSQFIYKIISSYL